MDTWTESDAGAARAFVADRLNADFAGAGLQKVEIRVDPAWTGTLGGDLILVSGGHEFPLDVRGGGVEQACAFAAFQLQDDAMGELNRPWPEPTNSAGDSVGVLTAPAEVDGVAVWELAGKPFCAIGHLHRAVEAAGWRIK
ncbi:hypothetical protein [Kribbella catacumbae]|uniref:hypothetical protein n=1 Tax=Kribbella catacumbae TaxID=460086 RepID=UPI000374134C|nr:hypothetical protein [Kribbella catacumbae]